MPSFSLYYIRSNDLCLFNRMILAIIIIIIIIIIFIYSGIFVIWDSWILIYHPPVSSVSCASYWAQMTLSGGKSKSADLKWQQCSQNQHYCYITLNCNHCLFEANNLSLNFSLTLSWRRTFSPYHIGISPLICTRNPWTGLIGISVTKKLSH